MLNRRKFLKSAVAGSFGLTSPVQIHAQRKQNSRGYFGVHSFIEQHPEAVFIMRTNVDVKTNAQAIKEAGILFGHSVFVPREKGNGSVPLTHNIAVKPNITCSSTSNKKYPLEYGMGINTDPHFVEGTIEALKELGLSGRQFHIREVNCPNDFGPRGYLDMAERTGANIRSINYRFSVIAEKEVKWIDNPGGWIHKKIPYLWPINTRDSWLLNIAKFKTHGMGLTLCCKNQQGSVAEPYQHFCDSLQRLDKMNEMNIVSNVMDKCRANYKRHINQGIPRWDDAYRMDIWAARTLDNISVSPTGLFIIEGVYGRDGKGFLIGPNKGPIADDEAWDYMTNIVIFGKDPFRVDIIGHWLGGQEPGNFGLFHLAMERGMSNVLNPHDIPVYLWEDGKVSLKPLTDFERTPLKTNYLPKENEPEYHLVNEPFDYTTVKTRRSELPKHPGSNVFSELHLNHVNSYLPIEFAVPHNGYARLEVLNSSLRPVDVLADGYYRRGYHLASLNTIPLNSGTYHYRYRFEDFDKVGTFVLL